MIISRSIKMRAFFSLIPQLDTSNLFAPQMADDATVACFQDAALHSLLC